MKKKMLTLISTFLCLTQLYGFLGTVTSASLKTAFLNSTVKRGASVELHLLSFSVNVSSFSLRCGYDDASNTFKNLAYYNSFLKTLSVSSTLPSNFERRVSIKNGHIIKITNMSHTEERLHFSCTLSYNLPSGEPRFLYGTRHLLKSVQDPPMITGSKLPSLHTVSKGGNLNLSCSFVSRPAPNVTWDGPLAVFGSQQIITTAIGSHINTTTVLLLTNAKDWWNTYAVSCHAVLETGMAKQESRLNVTFSPVNTSIWVWPKHPSEGDQVTLNCSSFSNPPIQQYIFLKNGKQASTSSSGIHMLTAPSCASVRYNYSCIPLNIVGKGEAREIKMLAYGTNITVAPTRVVEVIQNENVSLTCGIEGCPTLTYKWQKNGNHSVLGASSTLHFPVVTVKEAGVYTCTADNGAKKTTTNISLVVNTPASLSTLPSTNSSGCTGDKITIECIGGGHPLPSVELRNESHKLVSAIGRIKYPIIITKSDFGIYTCISTNKISSVSKNITLQRRVYLAEPRNVTLKSDKVMQLTVTLIAPRCMGRFKIHAYAVYVKKAAETTFTRRMFNCTSPQCTFLLEGLDASGNYEVQVAAVDIAGSEGARSINSNVNTKAYTRIQVNGDTKMTPAMYAIIAVTCAVVVIILAVGIYYWHKSKSKVQISPKRQAEVEISN